VRRAAAPGARILVVLAFAVRPLGAQLSDADECVSRGDYRTARARYQEVLARDSTDVSALYWLAVLDSWDGKLGRSLERFTVVAAPRAE